MKNPSNLMQAILTDETAQKIIDYVSPIYGNSYVGLWLFQAIGVAMGEVCELGEQLKYEANPATANLLLDYWEEHYGLPQDSEMTVEERQNRLLLNIQAKGPCNPKVLAIAVSSALKGLPVEITENVAKNTFLVAVKDSADDLTPGITVVKKKKPAHLLWLLETQIDRHIDLQVASAVTFAENHVVKAICDFHETVDTSLAPASAVTYSEQFITEVL